MYDVPVRVTDTVDTAESSTYHAIVINISRQFRFRLCFNFAMVPSILPSIRAEHIMGNHKEMINLIFPASYKFKNDKPSCPLCGGRGVYCTSLLTWASPFSWSLGGSALLFWTNLKSQLLESSHDLADVIITLLRLSHNGTDRKKIKNQRPNVSCVSPWTWSQSGLCFKRNTYGHHEFKRVSVHPYRWLVFLHHVYVLPDANSTEKAPVTWVVVRSALK